MVGGCVVAIVLMAGEPPQPVVRPLKLETRTEPKTTKKKPTRAPSPRVTGPLRPEKPATVSIDGLAESLGLRARLDGGYDYVGKRGEHFDATIRRDGVVVFEIDPEVDLKIDGVCVTAICVQRKPKTRRDQRRQRALTAISRIAEVAGGRFTTGTRNYGYSTTMPINYRPFDVQPPYPLGVVQGQFGVLAPPTAAMASFLDRTRQLRLRMAQEAAEEDREEQRKQLPRRLARIWHDESLSLDQKKTAIAEIWNGLAADEREARRIVIEFVRRMGVPFDPS
jgi:hypothetical protein